MVPIKRMPELVRLMCCSSILLIAACCYFGCGQVLAADFSPTGSMSTGRYYQTATRLPNGKVLITGGFNTQPANTSYSSAELYDSSSAAFSAAGSMSTGRDGHTATLLPDGKVLVIGGYNANGAGFLNSAELYDPLSGTFSHTTSMVMTAQRRLHTATPLADGKVLVAGGAQASGPSNILNTVDELYDPITETFTLTVTSMSVRRHSHTATRLPGGKVLIAGGWHDFNSAVSSAELYDPVSKTFTPSAHVMMTGRYGHTATLLANGKILITGGNDGTLYVSSAELYDPQTDTFTPTFANMTKARGQHAATLLSGGMVLITGGISSLSSLNSAELYDPDTDTFMPASDNMTALRYQQTSTMLTDGKVLIAGGGGPAGYTNSAELFDPSAYQGALVKIAGNLSAIFATLQGAYDAASANDVLFARNIVFSDSDFTLNRNISVSLKGGYDEGFAAINGYATMSGTLTVISGMLQMENLIIK